MNDFWCKKGHFNLDQAFLFKELVKENEPKYILETGFCTGRSASAILTNVQTLKKMISIDINFDYIKPEGRIYKNKLEDSFENFSTIENCSSKILSKDFFEKEFPFGIDWCTIDGDHSYKGCLFDLKSVVNYINKGGIIIVDDYKSSPPNGCSIPDVTRACDDFYKENQYLQKTEWNCKGKGFCIFKKIE
jgi:predicted O-methyltransferase YrrM